MSNTNYIVYRQEDEPKNKNGVWIHHKVYKDLSSPIIVQVYSQGKWQDIKDGKPSSGTIEGVGIKSIQSITKEEYDALEEKDPEVIYIVKNDPTNGHEWVDIGIVDDEGYHIVWATKNIGAENPWDAGKYFSWGDTVGYYADEGHEFSQENTPYWDSENVWYTKYNEEDGLTELQSEDDAAHVQWGGLWRVPNADAFLTTFTDISSYSQISPHDIYCLDYFNLILPIAGMADGNSVDCMNEYGQYISSTKEEDSVDSIRSFCFDFETPAGSAIEDDSRYCGQSIRPIIKVKDLSELDPTYDIYLGEDKVVDNSTKDSNMTNILYEDLVELRDNFKLVPGMWYRITDYQTTIAMTGMRSSGHQFDVIVLATDVNKLSEDAKAIKHDNRYNVTFADGITKKCYLYYYEIDNVYNLVDCDTLLGIDNIGSIEIEINESQKTISTTAYDSYNLSRSDLKYEYFQDCNLEAWKLNYCLDNDTTKFAWANNLEIPQWISSTDILDGEHLPYQGMHTIGGFESVGPVPVYGTKEQAVRFYRDETALGFVAFDPENAEVCFPTSETENLSIIIDGFIYDSGEPIENINLAEDIIALGRGVIYRMVDEWNNECPYDFKNIQFKRKLTDGEYDPEEGTDTWVYTFTWVNENDVVEDLSIVGSTLQDDEGQYPGIYGNVIKPVSISTKIYPDSPTKFGIALNDIVFISSYEVAGGLFYGCYSNTFGNNCFSNTFGHSCYSNIFGNGCFSITLGNNCSSNTFGSFCNNILFGNSNNVKSYYSNIIVENGNQFIYLDCTAPTSEGNYYQNVTISQGVNNSSTWKTITDSNVNQEYQTIYKTANDVEINVPEIPPTFGGLMIASGTLAYENGAYVIKDDWNHDSYNSVYGKNNGSTYFTFLEMGELFEKSGFSISDGDIENLLDPFDGWRLPTKNEWVSILTTNSAVREGSTINGNANKHYALVKLTGVTHAGSSTPDGLLIFPDGKTITGKVLSGMDNTTQTTGMTLEELDAYLGQGCAFLPASGYCFDVDWDCGGGYGYYQSSTELEEYGFYYLRFDGSDIEPYSDSIKEYNYYSVRLVKSI